MEIKNAFNGFISRLDMADKGISELEGKSIEISHEIEENKRKKNGKKQNI